MVAAGLTETILSLCYERLGVNASLRMVLYLTDRYAECCLTASNIINKFINLSKLTKNQTDFNLTQERHFSLLI